MNDEIVIEAIKTIKDYCKQHDCDNCIFNEITNCEIVEDMEIPMDWNI